MAGILKIKDKYVCRNQRTLIDKSLKTKYQCNRNKFKIYIFLLPNKKIIEVKSKK